MYCEPGPEVIALDRPSVVQASSKHSVICIADPRTQYRRYVEVEKALQNGTCKNIDHHLSTLEEFLKTRDRELLTADSRDIATFPDHLRAAGNEDRTVRHVMNSVHCFYKWLRSTYRIEYDPTAFVKVPKTWTNSPRSIPEDQLAELLEFPQYSAKDSRQVALILRERAILELLYGSAIRNSELTCLELMAVDLDNRRVTVYGKGGKTRAVPITDKAAAALRSYLDDARPHLALGIRPKGSSQNKTAQTFRSNSTGGKRFFLTIYGTPLEPSTLDTIVWKATRGAASPHILRHSCGTHMLDHGADIKNVQTLFGHEDIKSTNVYVMKTPPAQVKEAHNRCHPGAKWKPAAQNCDEVRPDKKGTD